MPQHHNPMQLGLVLDGFTRDEMLFDVAQGGSSSRATTTGPQVLRRGTSPTKFPTIKTGKRRSQPAIIVLSTRIERLVYPCKRFMLIIRTDRHTSLGRNLYK